MTKERKQQLALASLLLILVVFGGRRILGLLGADGSGRAATAGGRLFADGFSISEVEPLLVSELDPGADTFKLGRDPFQFAAAPPPKPAPTPPPTPAPNPAPPRPTVQPQPTPAGPQPPPVDVVYLGRFGPSTRPIAVFSDGKEIFNALEGGVLKGHFVVDKIGYESADLKFVGFPDAPSKRLAVGG